MAVVRWKPLQDITRMQRDMNSLFDSFFNESDYDYPASWSPRVDIKETKDDYQLVAELPGMNKGDVKITMRENTLQISGEKKAQEEDKSTNYHRIERHYGAFSRSFTLPSAVNASKINAVFKDGELKLTLPKVEEAKPKEIEIKAS